VQRNRLLLLAGALGAAVVVAVALILVATHGHSNTAATTTAATTAPAVTGSPLAGVPQRGDTLGRASAPATITVFEDPQCPFCRQWDVDTLPTVIAEYVKPGRVKLVYRGIEVIGPNSVPGLRAIYAAARQNKLWTLVDALYQRQGAENSGWITPAAIRAAARASGANGSAILDASGSAAVSAALAKAATESTADGVRGTPTFVIERPPGLPQQLSVAALDPTTFTTALDAALQ
jgi:protein-disulfide isomerase